MKDDVRRAMLAEFRQAKRLAREARALIANTSCAQRKICSRLPDANLFISRTSRHAVSISILLAIIFSRWVSRRAAVGQSRASGVDR